MLRATVRQLADDKIAPHAAEVDENAEFPQDVYDALVAADFHALHIPEEYGGAGRRRAGRLHRHRGGRPGLRVGSLIPAVNKLGTMPILLAARRS